MEEEKLNTDINNLTVDKKKSGFNFKPVLIGLPLFILQLVLVYFITANILLKKFTSAHAEETKGNQTEQVISKKTDLGKYIFLVDDLIVNPAGTDGKRLLLTSVGIDVPTEENENTLKAKEIVVKDIIISSLTSKTLEELNNSVYKDSLKIQIAQNIEGSIPEIKINNVYFSKYIIQ